MSLTKPQRARLDRLATYLEGLPEDYAHFNMSNYIVQPVSSEAEADYARRNGGVQHCGTAACAAGHGPAAGVLVPPRMFHGDGSVGWDTYSELFIGSGGYEAGLYGWLFSPTWDEHDNHHWGAAARIRYLLAEGEPPRSYVREREYPPAIALYAPYRIDAKEGAEA